MIRAQTPRRWGLGNPAEETFCHPNQKPKNQGAYHSTNLTLEACFTCNLFAIRTVTYSGRPRYVTVLLNQQDSKLVIESKL